MNEREELAMKTLHLTHNGTLITTTGQELGFGDICALAESLGWVDPDFLPWTASSVDETEQLALDFVASKIKITEEN